MSFGLQRVVCYLVILHYSQTHALASSPAHNITLSHASFINNTDQASQPSRTPSHSSSSTSKTEDVQPTSLATPHGVGDFVAMGLGISSTSEPSFTDTVITAIAGNSSIPSRPSVPHSSSQLSDGSTPAGPHQNASNIEAPPTMPPSIGITNQTSTSNATAVPTGFIPIGSAPPVWENQSLTLSGNCWNQWNQFWSAEDRPYEETTWWSAQSETTLTGTHVMGDRFMSTSTILSYFTTTVFNGRFPITTYSTLAPETVYEWLDGTPTSTWYHTETIMSVTYYRSEKPTVSLQSPSCVLPSIVSQCQESWDRWVHQETNSGAAQESWTRPVEPSGCNFEATTAIPWSCQTAMSSYASASHSFMAEGDPPKCTQAKVPDDFCSSERSEFFLDGEKRPYYFPKATSTETTVDGTLTSVMVWPSDQFVGRYVSLPGCTIGCGNCAMQGETVELIYWPPATSIANETATAGPAEPWTVETLGTTLTSPTVYISFDTLWAKNSCSNIGRTITKAIVAITKTEDMSSLWGIPRRGNANTASFNFTDLYHDPTPDEIYDRQPRCIMSSRAAQQGRYRPMPTNYTGCARTEPYEPILVIPMEVRDLDPAWAECRGGIEGVYDPPLALTPKDQIIVPTKSEVHRTTSSAVPAPGPSNPAPETTKAQAPSPQTTKPPKLPANDPTADNPPETDKKPEPEEPKTVSGSGQNVWPLPPSAFDLPSTTGTLSPLDGNAGQDPKETSQVGKEGGNNVQPPPAPVSDPPGTADALSILKSAQASAEAAQIAASIIADAAKHQPDSPGPAETGSAHRTQDPKDPINNAAQEPARSGQIAAVWTQEGEAFTAVLTDGSAVVQGVGAVTTVAAGNVATFKGQTISVPATGDDINVNGGALSPGAIENIADGDKANEQSMAVFTASGQTFTAARHDNSVVLQAAGSTTTMAYGAEATFAGQTVSFPSSEESAIIVNGAALSPSAIENVADDEKANEQAMAVFTASGQTITAAMHGSSVVLQAAGTTTTIAYGVEETFAGQRVSFPSSGKYAINVNGESTTMQTLNLGADARIPASTVWTQGGETFTAKMQGDSTIALEESGTTVHVVAGSAVTLGDTVFSVPSAGGVLVHDGTSVTLDRAAATDPAEATTASRNDVEAASAFDAGRSVIVAVGDRTLTLADGAQTTFDGRVISAASTGGGAIVIDGTSTMTVDATPSTADSSKSGSSGDAEESTAAATTGEQGVASSSSLSMQGAALSILLGLLVIAFGW